MRLVWYRTDTMSYWATGCAEVGGQVRVVVEELPDGTWDWTAWCAGQPFKCRSGVNTTSAAAIAAATAAAQGLGLDCEAATVLDAI